MSSLVQKTHITLAISQLCKIAESLSWWTLLVREVFGEHIEKSIFMSPRLNTGQKLHFWAKQTIITEPPSGFMASICTWFPFVGPSYVFLQFNLHHKTKNIIQCLNNAFSLWAWTLNICETLYHTAVIHLFPLISLLTEAHISVVYFRPPEFEIVINSHVSHEKMEFIICCLDPLRNKSMSQCITVFIVWSISLLHNSSGARVSVFSWLRWAKCRH